jgi:hypothetical protein
MEVSPGDSARAESNVRRSLGVLREHKKCAMAAVASDFSVVVARQYLREAAYHRKGVVESREHP